MQHVVTGYLRTPRAADGEREPYRVEVDAMCPAQAVMLAMETAELRGRRMVVETVQVTYRLVGVCRDCGEPVFEGGAGRSRAGELRCFDCGGGP